MYLTAQRVRSTATGEEGVNVYAYSHAGSRGNPIDWTNPDVVRIAEQDPGSLILSMRKVHGSGNRVRSYLDVVTSDAVPPGEIAAQLEASVHQWVQDPERPADLWNQGPLGIRLYVEGPLRGSAAVEFRELRQALLVAIAHSLPKQAAQLVSVAPPQLVRIIRFVVPGGFRYELHAASRAQLRRVVPGHLTLPLSVNISSENHDELSRLLGHDVHEGIVSALTHCTIDQIDALGGAVIYGEAGGHVWHSPHGPTA